MDDYCYFEEDYLYVTWADIERLEDEVDYINEY
jgi:hypothetical protein